MLVLSDDNLVEHFGGDTADQVIIFYTPIPDTCNDTQLVGSLALIRKFLKGPHSGWIVGIIEQNLEFLELKKIKASGSLGCRRYKRFQSRLHILNSYVFYIAGDYRRQDVLDHELGFSAISKRNIFCLHNSHFPSATT